jgi:hypothetical protein
MRVVFTSRKSTLVGVRLFRPWLNFWYSSSFKDNDTHSERSSFAVLFSPLEVREARELPSAMARPTYIAVDAQTWPPCGAMCYDLVAT